VKKAQIFEPAGYYITVKQVFTFTSPGKCLTENKKAPSATFAAESA
jgi:hypothetical protein